MTEISDFLPAEPPMLPLPRGLLKAIEGKEAVGAGYYGALAGGVFKKYLKKEIGYDQFIKETKQIERMFREEG